MDGRRSRPGGGKDGRLGHPGGGKDGRDPKPKENRVQREADQGSSGESTEQGVKHKAA